MKNRNMRFKVSHVGLFYWLVPRSSLASRIRSAALPAEVSTVFH